jgi:hypothetical protein
MKFRNLNTSVCSLLDIGEQPISNRYLLAQDDDELQHSIVLGQCSTTGLLCLVDPVPSEELVPKYDWITYSEPEPHLDDLVNKLLQLPGVERTSTVAGVSFKDTSTLERFEKFGLATWEVNANRDLGIAENAGVESVQSHLTAKTAKNIVKKNGLADVLIVRHIAEHAYDLNEFFDALKEMIGADGYIVLELPDCEDSLNGCDYTMLWEEHLYYFTEQTLKSTLLKQGFDLIDFVVYPYPMENSLVAIVKVNDRHVTTDEAYDLSMEFSRAKYYASQFMPVKNQVRKYLEDAVSQHGKVAFFGAGHLACTFIWSFQLQDLISCIIDDEPNKQGKYMPGSRVLIVGSHILSEPSIKLCLLSVNPLSEQKIVDKNEAFTCAGGQFLSIFPNSSKSIYKSLT